MRLPHLSPRDRTRLARTLLIGTVGGAIFFYFRLPLAWMLGAMVFTTAASVSGSNLMLPTRLRAVFMTVLGVFLGSAFTPDILDRVARWPVSMALLVAYVCSVTALLYLYFRRRPGFDPVTAFFSATPGGLSEMVLVGAALGGDVRRIALVHACRVLMVVLVIPFWFRYTEGDAAVTAGQGLSIVDAEALEMLVLLACAVVGAVVGRLLRLPASRVLGPMLASAAVHVTGLSHSAPPWELVAVAQVILGCSVGCRFTNTPLTQILSVMAISVGATAVMLLTTAVFAHGAASVTGLDWRPLVLAYSPGGLAEMSLIALALGIETAFVATHHIFRIILIVFTAPLAFRRLGRAMQRPRDEADRERGGP
jgi:membrane AbrB-like protein